MRELFLSLARSLARSLVEHSFLWAHLFQPRPANRAAGTTDTLSQRGGGRRRLLESCLYGRALLLSSFGEKTPKANTQTYIHVHVRRLAGGK